MYVLRVQEGVLGMNLEEYTKRVKEINEENEQLKKAMTTPDSAKEAGAKLLGNLTELLSLSDKIFRVAEEKGKQWEKSKSTDSSQSPEKQ